MRRKINFNTALVALFVLSLIVFIKNEYLNSGKSIESQSIVSNASSDKDVYRPLFLDKFLVKSNTTPIEENLLDSMASLSSLVYKAAKRYTFQKLIRKGVVNITINELRDNAESGISDIREYLNFMTQSVANSAGVKLECGNKKGITAADFAGYSVSCLSYKDGLEKSHIYYAALSGDNFLIIASAVYDKPSDLQVIEDLVQSIRKK